MSTLIDLRLLIGHDKPNCLYCGAECEVGGGGEAAMVFDSFDCKACGDYFHISQILGTENFWFQFTCKEFCISYDLQRETFSIDNTNSLNEEQMEIPLFEFDFSDREKLYSKLKTYLIFA